MTKIDKNPNAVNAPSDKEILESMSQSAPVSHNVDAVSELMKGYTEEINVDAPAAQEFIKGKRGRKKGQKNGMKADEIGTSEPGGFGEPAINENPIISGALLVMLIDIALPNLMAIINNKVSKKKIKASSLQLSEDERKQLEPLANQVAQEMSVKANPLTVLIISLVSMYGMKLMTQKTE
jgi:hypothetical protein